MEKKVDATFVNVSRVFPRAEPSSSATVNVAELARALHFLGVCAKKDECHRVAVEFTESEVVLRSSFTDYTGGGVNSSEIVIDGIPVPIIPCKFLLKYEFILAWVQACQRSGREFFLIEFYQKNYPVLFSTESEKYLLMVMDH